MELEVQRLRADKDSAQALVEKRDAAVATLRTDLDKAREQCSQAKANAVEATAQRRAAEVEVARLREDLEKA